MKRTALFLALVLVLAVFSAVAQDKLMRISADQLESRKEVPHLAFHSKEIARLLIPEHAEFGMIVVPSNGRERALSYDPVAHQLVIKSAAKSIWHELYKPIEENDLSRYKAPDVKTWAVRISDIQARKLRALWRHVVSTAEDKPDNMLDGVTWQFFIGGQQAKARRDYNPMVRFTQEIEEAVGQGSEYKIEFLIDFALDKTIERMDRLPADQDPLLSKRCRVVDTLVVANGEIMPSHLYRQGRTPREYFYQRQQIVCDERHYYRNALMQRDYAENYGIIARHHIYDITALTDTLCDAYVQQHPDMKKNLRRIEGFVKDEIGQPVINAWVYISGNGWNGGALTDAKGHFLFWTPGKENNLSIYCDSYSPLQTSFDTLPVTINLKSNRTP